MSMSIPGGAEAGGGGVDTVVASLAGRGPLMHSMASRQSMSLSQLLGGDEDAFQRLLAGALAGDAQQTPAPPALRPSADALSPRPSCAGDPPVRQLSQPSPLKGGLLASSNSLSPRLSIAPAAPAASPAPGPALSPFQSRRIATAASMSGPSSAGGSNPEPIVTWGSGVASQLAQSSFRRSASIAGAGSGGGGGDGGGFHRMVSAPGGMPSVPEGPASAAEAAGGGRRRDEEALLEFDLLDEAVAQAMVSHQQVDQIESRLDLPPSGAAVGIQDSPAAAAAAGRQPHRRRLWAQQDAPGEPGAAMEPAGLQTEGSSGAGDATPPVSPLRRTNPEYFGAPLSSPPPRRHTVGDEPSYQPSGAGMDVLGRRATAPDVAAGPAPSPLASRQPSSMMMPPRSRLVGSRQPSMRSGAAPASVLHASSYSRQQSFASANSSLGSAAPAGPGSSKQLSLATAGSSGNGGLMQRSMNLEEVYRAAQPGDLNPLSAGLSRSQRLNRCASP